MFISIQPDVTFNIFLRPIFKKMPRSWANYILKLNRSQLRSGFKGRKIRKMEDVIQQQSGGPKLQFKEVGPKSFVAISQFFVMG